MVRVDGFVWGRVDDVTVLGRFVDEKSIARVVNEMDDGGSLFQCFVRVSTVFDGSVPGFFGQADWCQSGENI